MIENHEEGEQQCSRGVKVGGVVVIENYEGGKTRKARRVKNRMSSLDFNGDRMYEGRHWEETSRGLEGDD